MLATASGGCDHGADGHGQRVGAQATAVVADAGGDDSGAGSGGDDASQGATDTPDVQAPEPEAQVLQEADSVPDATVVDEAGPVIDEAGSSGDEIDPPDVGSPSSGDDASGSSGGSGSGSGSSSGGTIIIIYIDSGSPAPPSQTEDASVESGGTPDSGNEAPSPTPPDSGRETGTPRAGVLSLHVPARDVGGQGGLPGTGDDSDASAFGDDGSSFFDDAGPSSSFGVPSYDGGDPNLDLPPSKAIIGCAGCSVPDATSSGTLAWLMVALTAGVRTLRRRK
ncbi:MAG TPA: MYXO-CTERM sorting domain-containing protein [Polyangiaceae bacterium]|nr:MYXO-CTERM sorting domain-containing protein [Polyangiaceae bacterium]